MGKCLFLCVSMDGWVWCFMWVWRCGGWCGVVCVVWRRRCGSAAATNTWLVNHSNAGNKALRRWQLTADRHAYRHSHTHTHTTNGHTRTHNKWSHAHTTSCHTHTQKETHRTGHALEEGAVGRQHAVLQVGLAINLVADDVQVACACRRLCVVDKCDVGGWVLCGWSCPKCVGGCQVCQQEQQAG